MSIEIPHALVGSGYTSYDVLRLKIGLSSRIYDGCSWGDNFQVGHMTTICGHVKVGNDVQIGHMVNITGDITIGNNVRIYQGTWIGGKGVIGDNVTIGDDCHIFEGVAGCVPHTMFPFDESKVVREFEIGNNTNIRCRCIISPGYSKVRIGDCCEIFDNCEISASSIGNHCSVNSYTAIASCILKDNVCVYTRCLVGGGEFDKPITIGENSIIGGGTTCTKSCDPNSCLKGEFALPFKYYHLIRRSIRKAIYGKQ